MTQIAEEVLDEMEKPLIKDLDSRFYMQGSVKSSLLYEQAMKANLILALRDVLALHGAIKQDFAGTQFDGLEVELVCSTCWELDSDEELCSVQYPCPTVTAITKALVGE
jgi:hypothetical protein